MPEVVKRPDDPPSYPRDGTYADLLVWHLEVWWTRPNGNTTKRGTQPWTASDLLKKVFNASRIDIENQKTLFANWTGTRKKERPGAENAKKISEAIFESEPQFSIWSNDLHLAWERSKGAGKNRRTISVDACLANLVVNGYIKTDNDHIGADAREGVAVVAEKLAEHFYGRGDDVAAISNFVHLRMAGGKSALLLITAPAGFGKSALAVNWCNETGAVPGRYVAKHLCSTSSGEATTSLDNIYANLRRQLAGVYGDATDKFRDKDAVVDLLGTTPPGDRQVVVWLDGIDEAQQPVSCFLPRQLGERVCVIVSARADEGTTPTYVDEWQHGERAKPHAALRWSLAKLSLDGVEEMVSKMFDAAKSLPPNGMARRIYDASEQGYTLFARLMVEDAIHAVRNGETLDFGEKSESLEHYATDQIKRLEKLGDVWDKYEPLFTFMTFAREAVRLDELPALLEQTVHLGGIPPQISRWLVAVNSAENDDVPLVSFTHPKLQELFGNVLKYQRNIATIDVCERMFNKNPNKWPSYALRHIPWHLSTIGRLSDASYILSNDDLIYNRFLVLGVDECPFRMQSDWRYWQECVNNAKLQLSDHSSSLRHIIFWANYDVGLKSLVNIIKNKTWLQLMSDMGVIDRPQRVGLLNPGLQFFPQSLATMKGHDGPVEGVLLRPNEKGFLSWSSDATMRLWQSNGEPGPVLRGHSRRVAGAIVRPDGEGFLSWSDDGTLRMWGINGEIGAEMTGHDKSIRGVSVLTDGAGFMSWSEDCTLRLWGSFGEREAVLRGHLGPIGGALELPDNAGLLSWSDDGSLRVWGKDGQFRHELPGHDGVINGVTLLSGRVLSWGQNGRVRFSALDGEHIWNSTIFGGSEVLGISKLENGSMIAWGGGLKFWGEKVNFENYNRHLCCVLGVARLSDGGILSWDEEGKMYLTGPQGQRGPSLLGHASEVKGAVELVNGAGFLSWSADNTIRHWSWDGKEKGSIHGHEDCVNGALVLPNNGGLLSWSDDATLRIWPTLSNFLYNEDHNKIFDSEKAAEPFSYRPSSNKVNRRSEEFSDLERSLIEGLRNASGFMRLMGNKIFVLWDDDGQIYFYGSSGIQLLSFKGIWPILEAFSLPKMVGFICLTTDNIMVWMEDDQEHFEVTAVVDAKGLLSLPDDNGFISWDYEGTIQFWGGDGRMGRAIKAHSEAIDGVSLLSNGGYLSWSRDHTFRLWRAVGEEGPEFRGHEGPVSGAFVVSGGSRFVSWGEDRTVRLWNDRGECLETWVSPSGRVTHVHHIRDDLYHVVFGGHVGEIRLQ